MRQALIRIGAIVRKEFRHLGRDPRMLLAVVITPVIQLLLFAYAISFDVDHVPTIVIDLDQTPASQRYLQQYEALRRSSTSSRHGRSLADVDRRLRPQHRPSRDRHPLRLRPDPGQRTRGAGRGPHRRQRAERRQDLPGLLGGAQPAVRPGTDPGLGGRAGPRPVQLRPAGAADPHLVQPGAALVGLPDPRPDGGDHRDRHRAADRRHPGQGARPRHPGAARGQPDAPHRADGRQAPALDADRLPRRRADHRPGQDPVRRAAAGQLLGPGRRRGPVRLRLTGHGPDDLRARADAGHGEHDRLAGRLPAVLPAVRVRLRPRPDPDVPAVDQLRLPGPVHGHASPGGCSSRAPGSPRCGRSWRRWPCTRW